jgi:hypothetical protein
MYFITRTIAFHSSRGIDRLKQPNIDIKIKVERTTITGIFGHVALYSKNILNLHPQTIEISPSLRAKHLQWLDPSSIQFAELNQMFPVSEESF